MTDRHTSPGQAQRSTRPSGGGYTITGGGGGRATGDGVISTIFQKLHDHAPNSTQVVGFMTLVISGGILLILTGLTLTATLLGLIFFLPLILLTSPIWVPVGFVLFMAIAGTLSLCGVVVAVLAGISWMYKYFKGRHPLGSDRFDYARSRIADTASHVKDYAREYGWYLQSKVKDAAPGA